MIRVSFRHGALWVLPAVVALVEWLRTPSVAWAAGALGVSVVALLLAARGRRLWSVAASSVVLGGAVLALLGSVVVATIEGRWLALRERRLTAASERLGGFLEDALAEARRLAAQGAAAQSLPREQAFGRLEGATNRAAFEASVVLFDRAGAPWAWGGRTRGIPEAAGPADAARLHAFYAVLESRRQTPEGWAVATVLVDADSLVADRAGAVATRFELRTGVGLRVLPADQAPTRSDVFDFKLTDPATGATLDTLFSVQLLPPRQSDAKLAAVRRWSRWVVRLLVVALVMVGVAGPTATIRLAATVTLAWLAARAPLGEALFSPATFYRSLLGPFSSSAGALGALAAASCVGAIALWHRGLRIRWWSWLAAGILITGTPFALRELGRGISPPASGATLTQWLSWELALALVAAALVLAALALMRGEAEPRRTPRRVVVGLAWATVAGVAGLWLWEPRGAWPDWYGYTWLPAVVLITVPAARRAVVVATAVAAGTAAAIITWGATIEGRLGLATRDVERLGSAGDPLAVATLERLAEQIPLTPPPQTSGDLYRLWRRVTADGDAYPAWVALWGADGILVADLALAEVDAPAPLLRQLMGEPPRAARPRLEALARIPGRHYVLVGPLSTDQTLTAVVGPRSRLVPPQAVARFLRNERPGSAPYTLELGLPAPQSAPTPRLAWHRQGWRAHGERLLDLPGGVRPLHASVTLGGAAPTLVRGALVVLLDAAVLGLLWLLVVVARGELKQRLWIRLAGMARSYRVRLTLVLAAFFVLPTLGFALWTFGRLNDDVRRSRDLVVRQTLRDAALTAGGAGEWEEPGLSRSLFDVGRRLDAELLFYRGPVLARSSAPVLGELGLVDPLLPPSVFQALVLGGEVEETGDAAIAGRPTRVGYRTVAGGTPEAPTILAAPQWLDDTELRGEQLDLAYLLALATLAGVAASIWLAGLAARQLARPVAALRGAALAVGRGDLAPALPVDPPDEFRHVMDAFRAMARDVQVGREQLEAARRRTALVLEHVATGVVAVAGDLTVALANPRAERLLERRLEPGTPADRGDPAWEPVWAAVRSAIGSPADTPPPLEFDVVGRRIRVQVARLGDGAVVALDDATELARAERVLAWGEMARQVAHEIKNPLTPLRLGLQHLERVYREQPEAFPSTFAETGRRLQAEIVRLDAIARAFSRFGLPAAAPAAPLESVAVDAVAGEVVALYRLGEDGIAYELEAGADLPLPARRDEVQEVLINLIENARNAGARRVRVRTGLREVAVSDDGRGIAPERVSRIFEPRFSSTTSGAGLGLAIVKRIVESWGATVAVESAVGRGTTVAVRWPG